VVKNGASRVVDGSTAAALGQNPSLPTILRAVLSDCYRAALPGGIGEASCTSKRVEDSTFDQFRKVKKQQLPVLLACGVSRAIRYVRDGSSVI
jgi:hypothetical protein